MKSISKLKDEARKHEQREEWEKAIQSYLQVLSAGEEGAGDLELPLFNRVGDLYVRLNRPRDAVHYYEQAADRYADVGLYNNAIALCNKALRYMPGQVALLRKLGQFSASQGFLTDARRYLLEYAEKQFAAGDVGSALTALEEFAEVADDAEIREGVGRRLHNHGRVAEALVQLKHAYALRRDAGQHAAAETLRREIALIDPDALGGAAAPPAAPGRAPLAEVAPPTLEAPAPTPLDAPATPLDAPAPAPLDAAAPTPLATSAPTPLDVSALMPLDASALRPPEPQVPASAEPHVPSPLDARASAIDPNNRLDTDLGHGLVGEEAEPDATGFDVELAGFDPAAAEPGSEPVTERLEGFETGTFEGFAGAGGSMLEGFEPAPAFEAPASEAPAEETQLQGLDRPDLAEPEPLPGLTPDDLDSGAGLDTPEAGSEASTGFFDLPLLDDIAEPEAAPQPLPLLDEPEEAEPPAVSFDLPLLDDEEDEAEPLPLLDEIEEAVPEAFAARSPAGAPSDEAETTEAGSEAAEPTIIEQPAAVEVPPETAPLPELEQPTWLVGDRPAARVEAVEGPTAEPAAPWPEEASPVGSLGASVTEQEAPAAPPAPRTVDADELELPAPRVWRVTAEPESPFAGLDLELDDAIGDALPADVAPGPLETFDVATPSAEPAVYEVEELAAAAPEAAAFAVEEPAAKVEEPAGETRAPAAFGEPIEPALPATEAAPAAAARAPAAEPGLPPAEEARGEPVPPRVGDQEEYIDLAALLADPDKGTDTRFVVQERPPTGDEDRDFAELLSQFKQKVADHVSAEDAGAHYDLGLAFKEMGLIDEAIGEFQVALRAGHMRLKVFEELGQCFLQKEQYNIAEKILRRALESSFDDELELLGVYYHLGRACEGLGKREAARDAYERVLGLDINFGDVSARLARL